MSIRKIISLPTDLFSYYRREQRIPGIISNSTLFCWIFLLKIKIRNIFSCFLSYHQCDCMVLAPLSRGRYEFQVMYILSRLYDKILVGWDVDLPTMRSLNHEGRLTFSIKNVSFTSEAKVLQLMQNLNCRTFIRSDRKRPRLEFMSNLTIIDDCLSQDRQDDSVAIPYCIYPPRFLNFNDVLPISDVAERPIKVFFSGLLRDPARHDVDFVERHFAVPPREKSVAYLNASIATIIDTRRPLAIRAAQAKAAVCLPTDKGRADEWFQELCLADFFICLPGSHMLLCHNIIEAMLCGCIPILSYETWFDPPLEDGVNCLSYRSLDQLLACIRQALAMDPRDVKRMRLSVMTYYKENLELDRFLDDLRSQNPFPKRFYINTENSDDLIKAVKNPTSILLSRQKVERLS